MQKEMVSEMAEEKTTASRPEELSAADLSEKQNSKLSNILEDEVITYAEERPADQRDEDYVYVYRGDALNEEELFQLSAKEDIKLVLIAGPQYSGKTTLIVMLYYLFLEGRNRTLRFGGSLTMEGFRRRSKKILLNSGEATPAVDRTSRLEQNLYLHLVLVDANDKKSNLILTDISGEMFTPSYMERLSKLYNNCENVILTMDGEKLQDPLQRHHEVMQTIQLLKNLLTCQIMTKHSKLQIICTKQDLIEAQNRLENTLQFVRKKWENIQTSYESEVHSLEFQVISALNLDCEDTPERLEQIMLRCLETVESDSVALLDEPKLQRYFDKFKMRG